MPIMEDLKLYFAVKNSHGLAVSKRFAGPNIVVVPTVKARRLRQASNRILVGRHGMFGYPWEMCNLIRRKWKYKVEMGFRREEIEPRLCSHEGFLTVLLILQILLSECSLPLLLQGSPCTNKMLDGIVYGTTKFDSRYPFRIKIKYILQFWFYALMPNFVDCLKVIWHMNFGTWTNGRSDRQMKRYDHFYFRV